jgi:hypothetical protein
MGKGAQATNDKLPCSRYALFAWFISHQPTVLFSQNKSATSNQPAILLSQNKSAPTNSNQPNEQASRVLVTTRHDTVARGMRAEVPYHNVDKLEPEDAWTLLKKQVRLS